MFRASEEKKNKQLQFKKQGTRGKDSHILKKYYNDKKKKITKIERGTFYSSTIQILFCIIVFFVMCSWGRANQLENESSS